MTASELTEIPEIAVIGEALMDIVEAGDDEPRLARPGGSPYNVALGLARLGRRAGYVGRLSHDPLGQMLRTHAERSAVDLRWTVAAHEPSTVALVSLDEHGGAQYRFGVDGTADFRFTAAELERVPATVGAVHFGSLTSWLAPGDAAVAARVRHLRQAGAAVSYDPNVRPHLQPDAARARRQVEDAVRSAHLVKVSEEDLAWTHPDQDAAEVVCAWLSREPGRAGPVLVVLTHGASGASAFTADGVAVTCRPHPIEVVDTVGAGDAFMAGLLDALLRRGLMTPTGLGRLDESTVRAVVDDAALVAAITCTRAGANPPRRADVEAFG